MIILIQIYEKKLLRSYIPNCGARFILEDDLTIYTTFSEVTPSTLFSIFKKLSTYPEFDSDMLLKTTKFEEEHGDGDENEVEDEDESANNDDTSTSRE